MKFRSTWALLAICIAVVAFFFLVEERGRVRNERKAEHSRKLFPFRRHEVEKIILLNPHGDRIEMVRRDTDWSITHPVTARGANTTIDFLLQQLVPGSRVDRIENVERFSDFGLERPYATTIFITGGGSRRDTLHAGDSTPSGTRCYMRQGSSPDVFLSREISRNVMNKTLYHLRDKQLFHFPGESIDGFTVRHGVHRLTLVRKGNLWFLTDPPAIARREKVEPYLTELVQALIHGFEQENTKDLVRFDLDAPSRKLTLNRGTETITVSFGNRGGDLVHAVRSGLDKVVLVKDGLLEAFDWTREDIQTRKVFLLDPKHVSRIRCLDGRLTIGLAFDGRRWRSLSEDTSLVDTGVIDGLFSELQGIEFETLLFDPAKPGVATVPGDSLTIVFEDRRGNTIDRIVFFEGENGKEYATSSILNSSGTVERGTASRVRRLFEIFTN